MIGPPRIRMFLLVALSLAMAACGSNSSPPQVPPGDPELDAAWRLARFAFREDQRSQAVTLYEKALARAHARDDIAAAGDIGYEYALALLRAGRARDAADQARRTRSELERREIAPFAELFLVEGVAEYDSGNPARARGAATAAIRRAPGGDTATRGRAHFILGMLAADAGDAAGVGQALAAMGNPPDDALRPDRTELRGRQLVLSRQYTGAMGIFEDAADLRRELRDYRGMARVLAESGAAANAAGDRARAADLFLRAGRSAAVQEDADKARIWLEKALALADATGRDDIAADARTTMETLARP